MLIRFSSRPGDYWTERQPVDAWNVFPTSREAAQLMRDRGLIRFAPTTHRHYSRAHAA